MKTYLTAKQYAEYKRFCIDRYRGRLLTPDGIRFICESHGYDAESIGKHFLDVLAKFQSERMEEKQ